MSDLVPVTPWVRRRQHLAETENLQDDPQRPGRFGRSLCNQDSGRVYDQAWMTAELERWSEAPVLLTDLPLCKRCERSARRAGRLAAEGGEPDAD